MRALWQITIGALFLTICLWPSVVPMLFSNDYTSPFTRNGRQVLGYPIFVVPLLIAWCFLYRSQIESGKLSLAGILALITALSLGLCVARFVLS